MLNNQWEANDTTSKETIFLADKQEPPREMLKAAWCLCRWWLCSRWRFRNAADTHTQIWWHRKLASVRLFPSEEFTKYSSLFKYLRISAECCFWKGSFLTGFSSSGLVIKLFYLQWIIITWIINYSKHITKWNSKYAVIMYIYTNTICNNLHFKLCNKIKMLHI